MFKNIVTITDKNVYDLMSDGVSRKLPEIKDLLNDSVLMIANSISHLISKDIIKRNVVNDEYINYSLAENAKNNWLVLNTEQK